MTENKNDTSSTSLTSSGLSSKKEKSHIPEYLQSVYKRRYLDPFLSKFFDDEWVAGLGNFFYGRKLTKIVTSEIVPGNDVLQLGIASGSFERNVASRMDSQGVYHIEDVSFAHIQAAKRRVSPWLNVEMKKRDFTIENDCRYDVVLGYFVLHELPDARKKATLKRAFNALKSRGKMIFIDYARPQKFHLLKYHFVNWDLLHF